MELNKVSHASDQDRRIDWEVDSFRWSISVHLNMVYLVNDEIFHPG